MGNSGWTADPFDITLPPNAGPGDPRVYIGSNDPVLSAIGNDAGIVWYFGNLRAFALTVEQSGDDTFGQLHLYAYDSVAGLFQLADFDFDVDLAEARVFLAQGGSADTDVAIGGRLINLGGLGFLSDKENTDIEVYGRSMGRGLAAEASEVTDSAGNTAETVVLTTGVAQFVAGRAYRAITSGGFTQTVAGAVALVRIRKTNAAGQLLGELHRYQGPATGTTYAMHGSAEFVCGTSTLTALCMTLTAGGGSTVVHKAGAAGLPRTLTIEDIGSAADFPDRPSLV